MATEMQSCFICEQSLSGGIDTFGDRDQPFCAVCYLTLQEWEQQESSEMGRIKQEHYDVSAKIDKIEDEMSKPSLDAYVMASLDAELKSLQEQEEGLYWSMKMRPGPFGKFGR